MAILTTLALKSKARSAIERRALWLDDTNPLQAPEIKTVNVRLTVPCPR